MKCPPASGGRRGAPPRVHSRRGKGRYCLERSRKRRVWEEERKRTEPSRSSQGGKSRGVGKPKGFFPEPSPFPTPFYVGGSPRRHLQQHHGKTPSRLPSTLHPRRWDLSGVEKCRLLLTSSEGADFSGLLLFLKTNGGQKKKEKPRTKTLSTRRTSRAVSHRTPTHRVPDPLLNSSSEPARNPLQIDSTRRVTAQPARARIRKAGGKGSSQRRSLENKDQKSPVKGRERAAVFTRRGGGGSKTSPK